MSVVCLLLLLSCCFTANLNNWSLVIFWVVLCCYKQFLSDYHWLPFTSCGRYICTQWFSFSEKQHFCWQHISFFTFLTNTNYNVYWKMTYSLKVAGPFNGKCNLIQIPTKKHKRYIFQKKSKNKNSLPVIHNAKAVTCIKLKWLNVTRWFELSKDYLQIFPTMCYWGFMNCLLDSIWRPLKTNWKC